MDMYGLNARQERFAHEYATSGNATRSAIRAGYSENTAASQGNRLLKKAKILILIEQLKNETYELLEANRESVIRELTRVGLFDPRRLFNAHGDLKPITELDDDTAAAVKSVEVVANRSGRGEDAIVIDYTHKIQLHDKMSALQKLGEHLNLFKEHQESGSAELHIHLDDKDSQA